MSEQIPATSQATARPRKKWSQERAMMLIALIFFGGVIALTIIPEDSVIRGLFMPLFMIIVFWALFKR